MYFLMKWRKCFLIENILLHPLSCGLSVFSFCLFCFSVFVFVLYPAQPCILSISCSGRHRPLFRHGQGILHYDGYTGNATITGRDIEMKTQGNLSIGEPDSEGGEPAGQAAFVSGAITFRIGEDGSEISLTEEARICAAFIRLEASDRTPASSPSAKKKWRTR